MSLIQLIEFPILGDDRGSLVSLEGNRNIPFEVKRAYYIFGTREGVSRGFHAHKKLEQVAICVSGQCRMIMDDGIRREEVWLNSPNKAIYIGNMIWREMHDFSPDCVLLVLAGDYYSEADYIRSYKDFLKVVN